MAATLNEVVGFAGLALLLIAFVLNLVGRLDEDDVVYSALNAAGGTLLVYYSYMLGSIPFLILELVWTGFAVYTLVVLRQN